MPTLGTVRVAPQPALRWAGTPRVPWLALIGRALRGLANQKNPPYGAAWPPAVARGGAAWARGATPSAPWGGQTWSGFVFFPVFLVPRVTLYALCPQRLARSSSPLTNLPKALTGGAAASPFTLLPSRRPANQRRLLCTPRSDWLIPDAPPLKNSSQGEERGLFSLCIVIGWRRGLAAYRERLPGGAGLNSLRRRKRAGKRPSSCGVFPSFGIRK